MILEDLLNKDLSGWSLQKVFALYIVDANGQVFLRDKARFFKKLEIAKTLESNDLYLELSECTVLTDGINLIRLDNSLGGLKIFAFENEEEKKIQIQEEIMKKLTPEEIKMVGLTS